MPEKILIVEDEPVLQETLAYNLTRQGYLVESVGDGQLAVDTARRYRPDLILLDIMLPGIDGFEVCRLVRQEMNVPILMLTARDDEIDRVIGLEIGADDYITKPFSMRELMARVKAHLRRMRMLRQETETLAESPAKEIVRFDNLVLDLSRREVSCNDKVLTLKPKEYDLLLYFARHRGQALSREKILEDVWGWNYTGGSRTVDVHVRWLRAKIELDATQPKRIVTVRGAGYRFEG
jgi:DNA-binding response OmpR family regulator